MAGALPTLEILIPTLPEREALLEELLNDLDLQIGELPVSVTTFGGKADHQMQKLNFMIADSKADYIVCVDDDDVLDANFITSIFGALAAAPEGTEPDFVGYYIPVFVDEEPGEMITEPNMKHVWKASIAKRHLFEHYPTADAQWAREAYQDVIQPIFIEEPLYIYDYYPGESAYGR